MNLLCKIFFAMLLFANTAVFAQLPYNNLGFENGTFDGWECVSGIRDNRNNFVMNAPGAPNSRHVVIGPSQKDELDPYGHFPVLCPNGSNYSIKLGSIDTPRFVERISRTLSNIPSNFSLVFNYAIVLDANAAHGPNDQPLFNVEIFDAVTNDKVPCPSFNFVADLAIPGFTTSDVLSDKIIGNDTYPVYRDWTTAMIDLKDYAGRDLRIEFTTADCNGNIHFAYAYIDIDEKLSLKPITGSVFCKGQDSTTLIAPDGYEDYIWSGDNFITTYHGKSYKVPAVDKASYVVKLIAYPGFGCDDILYTTLAELSDDFKLIVASQVFVCPGTAADLTAPVITNGSAPGLTYSYYFENSLGIVYLPNPKAVSKPGKYYIRGTNGGGCTDIKEIEVVIYPTPNIKVTNPNPVQYPAKVDLSTTHDRTTGFTYSYFKDAAATTAIDQYVSATGTYYIKATATTSCTNISSVKIVVDPPPPYTIDASNTFTPNGDGINDNFFIKTTGYVTLTQLTIFNRYGQLVFTARSINDHWTGTNSGSTLPEGTYYWIFEGTDDYFHTKVKRASSITIVR
jgi:gliding motility-associated-like protein